MTAIGFMQRDTSPSHIVDQAVDCGLWNVVPLNDCAKLMDNVGNWNLLSYTFIKSIPNMLNGCLSMQAMEELGYFQLPGIVYRSL